MGPCRLAAKQVLADGHLGHLRCGGEGGAPITARRIEIGIKIRIRIRIKKERACAENLRCCATRYAVLDTPVANLLFRRLPIGRTFQRLARFQIPFFRGLKTAGGRAVFSACFRLNVMLQF